MTADRRDRDPDFLAGVLFRVSVAKARGPLTINAIIGAG
jgi:hypothetical protein